MPLRILYTSVPSEAAAHAIGEEILTQKLAACITVLPAASSVF